MSKVIRSSRITLRLTSQELQMLNCAAKVANKTLNQFILDSACLAAEQTLRDRDVLSMPVAQSQTPLLLPDRHITQ